MDFDDFSWDPYLAALRCRQYSVPCWAFDRRRSNVVGSLSKSEIR